MGRDRNDVERVLHTDPRPPVRSLRLSLGLALCALLSCLCPKSASGAPNPGEGVVVVLESDDLAAYEKATDAYRDELSRPVRVMELKGSRVRADDIVHRLHEHPPALIYALGAKAAFVAVNELSHLPVVYGMVRDPARYGIHGEQVTGVRVDLPYETVMSQFRLFVPDARTLGVILGPEHPHLEAMAAAARATGFELVTRQVEGARQVRPVLARMCREVDALWVLPDPDIVTPETYRFMREQARRSGLPLLAGTEALVTAGALLAVVPDYEAAGRQAATLTRRILGAGIPPAEIEPVPPEKMRVVLNRDTLHELGLELDPLLLDFADEVLETPQGR